MASIMMRAASVTLHRLVPAALLAATATLAGSAVGDPAAACAASREWDVDQFDRCTADLDLLLMAGDITPETHLEFYRECCQISGGVWDGKCGAPPAAAPGAPPTSAPEAVDPDAQPGAQPSTTKPKPGPAPQVPTFVPAPAPVG
jgi:hypothetical protein